MRHCTQSVTCSPAAFTAPCHSSLTDRNQCNFFMCLLREPSLNKKHAACKAWTFTLIKISSVNAVLEMLTCYRLFTCLSSSYTSVVFMFSLLTSIRHFCHNLYWCLSVQKYLQTEFKGSPKPPNKKTNKKQNNAIWIAVKTNSEPHWQSCVNPWQPWIK